jgi:uncharacterized protein (TIGR00369 family)
MKDDIVQRPKLDGRPAADSHVVMSIQMNPGDANPTGNVHGGTIMKLVDTAAGVAAMRHCRTRVVTVSLDSMSFLHPVFVGNIVTVRAAVNDTGTTSMEVGVRVEAENIRTGEIRHTSSAYLVFVALDDEGNPTQVPPLIVKTAAEKRRQEHAKIRRETRKARQEAIKRTMDPGFDPEAV